LTPETLGGVHGGVFSGDVVSPPPRPPRPPIGSCFCPPPTFDPKGQP
jgi:hypothetical protein